MDHFELNIYCMVSCNYWKLDLVIPLVTSCPMSLDFLPVVCHVFFLTVFALFSFSFIYSHIILLSFSFLSSRFHFKFSTVYLSYTRLFKILAGKCCLRSSNNSSSIDMDIWKVINIGVVREKNWKMMLVYEWKGFVGHSQKWGPRCELGWSVHYLEKEVEKFQLDVMN